MRHYKELALCCKGHTRTMLLLHFLLGVCSHFSRVDYVKKNQMKEVFKANASLSSYLVDFPSFQAGKLMDALQ